MLDCVFAGAMSILSRYLSAQIIKPHIHSEPAEPVRDGGQWYRLSEVRVVEAAA